MLESILLIYFLFLIRLFFLFLWIFLIGFSLNSLSDSNAWCIPQQLPRADGWTGSSA